MQFRTYTLIALVWGVLLIILATLLVVGSTRAATIPHPYPTTEEVV